MSSSAPATRRWPTKPSASNRTSACLLPCNVVVYEADEGTRVAVINAGAMLGMVGNDQLAGVAIEVQERLDRVLAVI